MPQAKMQIIARKWRKNEEDIEKRGSGGIERSRKGKEGERQRVGKRGRRRRKQQAKQNQRGKN